MRSSSDGGWGPMFLTPAPGVADTWPGWGTTGCMSFNQPPCLSHVPLSYCLFANSKWVYIVWALRRNSPVKIPLKIPAQTLLGVHLDIWEGRRLAVVLSGECFWANQMTNNHQGQSAARKKPVLFSLLSSWADSFSFSLWNMSFFLHFMNAETIPWA